MQVAFVDTSGYCNAARAQALVAKAAADNAPGYRKLLRCVGGSQPLTPGERAEVEASGVDIIGAYQMYPAHYSVAAGQQLGTAAPAQAKSGGLRAQDVMPVDLEGNFGEDYFGHISSWLTAAYSQLTAMGILIKIYVGVGAAQALSQVQMDALTKQFPGIEWWTPYPKQVAGGSLPSPNMGWWASQYQDNVTIGSGSGAQAYDLNCWGLGANATAHPDHDDDHPANPTAADVFWFTLKAGESVGARHARCWREALAGGPMGNTLRAAFYASFINATTPAGYLGGSPVNSIAAWSTSCLITQEASLHHCEWPNPPHGPPVNGDGFYSVLGFAAAPIFVPFTGSNLPEEGDILYWASNGTNGHVECFLGLDVDGKTWNTAGGGGGNDGTQCSLRKHVNGADAYGRPLQGWWSISQQKLPESSAKPVSVPPSEAPTKPSIPNPKTIPPTAPTTTNKIDATTFRLWADRIKVLLATGGASLGVFLKAHWGVIVILIAIVVTVLVVSYVERKRALRGNPPSS